MWESAETWTLHQEWTCRRFGSLFWMIWASRFWKGRSGSSLSSGCPPMEFWESQQKPRSLLMIQFRIVSVIYLKKCVFIRLKHCVYDRHTFYFSIFTHDIFHDTWCYLNLTLVYSLSSVPKVEFKQAVLTAEESEGQISAMIHRSGDIRHKSTVRCYTRQDSAQVASDFDERPNTDASIITFLPGKQTPKTFK